MDRAGGQIEARRSVDLAGQHIKPGGAEYRYWIEPDYLKFLHQIAEDGALSTARGKCLLLQLVFEIGLSVSADDNGLELVVIIDAGDPILGPQHILIEQIADREVIGMIADCHHRDDLAAIEEQSQRTLHDNRGLNPSAFVIDTGDGAG